MKITYILWSLPKYHEVHPKKLCILSNLILFSQFCKVHPTNHEFHLIKYFLFCKKLILIDFMIILVKIHGFLDEIYKIGWKVLNKRKSMIF